MSWELLLTISVLTTSVAVLLQRVLLREEKSDPVAYVIVYQLLGGFFIGIFAAIRGFRIPDIHPIILNLALMSFLWSAANVFTFKSLKLIEASEFTILFASRALWAIIAAVILLYESFSLQQVLGTFLILASVVLVSWRSHRLQFGRGQIFAFLGAMMFGLGVVNDSFIARTFDVPSYFTFSFIIPGLLIWATFPNTTNKMKSLFVGKAFFKTCLLALLAAVSALTYLSAYQIGRNAAQIASLNQTSTVISVILAILVLKERGGFIRKLVAAALSVTGVILAL